jgi:uncharacterized protein YdcH (DUF465 family)
MDETITEDADSPQEALDKLQQKHQSLEERLSELKDPRSVSPEEEREIQNIKKQKLAIKDKMKNIREDL